MRLLVTGGMGDIGRPTVQWLLDKGHEVRVLDLHCDPLIEGVECFAGSIMDYSELHRYMEGMEGVIHLAAYRAPGLAPETELFRVNVDGTFNIFRAAADAGIKRVVCASSINALGYNFGIKFPEGQLRYFPIDEEHPTYTTDPYSFSKQLNEEIGRYFWRREGISSLFLRYPGVYDPSGSQAFITNRRKFVERSRAQTMEIMNLPQPQRSEKVRQLIADHAAFAQSRMWEKKVDFANNPEAREMFEKLGPMFARSNFWTLLDVRDAAQAAEKGLLANYEGSHAVYINDDHNILGIPSRELAEVWFPDVRIWKGSMSGTESLVSIDRARELIGFEVMFPFRLD